MDFAGWRERHGFTYERAAELLGRTPAMLRKYNAGYHVSAEVIAKAAEVDAKPPKDSKVANQEPEHMLRYMVVQELKSLGELEPSDDAAEVARRLRAMRVAAEVLELVEDKTKRPPQAMQFSLDEETLRALGVDSSSMIPPEE